MVGISAVQALNAGGNILEMGLELLTVCDILTMSATPIPRTLHLSMLGLRDISLITTPPTDRLPVKTYIAKYDEDLIMEAVQREMQRGGQVFFVHNRVDDIQQIAARLASLLPDVRIAIGHGQMPEHRLEKVILEFLEGKSDILVCTTIIESGIDMPRVNTLIVNQADRFGLAQLYQLRGRVGRSSRQAYAYFLTPQHAGIAEDALKRLNVIGEHQGLGAGFAIANFDLELRGVGNLLGPEQSGHTQAIGLDMYLELLEEAIRELQGKPIERVLDTELKLTVSAYLPKAFVPDERQRLKLYKAIFSATDTLMDERLKKQLKDQYGPIPAEAERLFAIAKLKRRLAELGIIKFVKTTKPCVFEITFSDLPSQRADALIGLIHKKRNKYSLRPNNRLLLDCGLGTAGQEPEFSKMLISVHENLDEIAAALQIKGS